MTGNGSTIHDVAERAGVSIATVSRVMHMHSNVRPETRDRVLTAIRELNYTPNESSLAQASSRHDTLGFVVPGLSGPFYGDIVQGSAEAALEFQQSVLLLSTHQLPGGIRHIITLVSRVDALALLGGTVSSDQLQHIHQMGKPMVLVSQYPQFDIPTVRIDNITSTRALTRHLIDVHGFRRFAFAGSYSGSPDAEDRWNAVCSTLEEAGIQPPMVPIPAEFDFTAGTEVVKILMEHMPLPDVLICGNDQIAIGTISALEARGVRVPADIAVTGWDDIAMAAHTVPPLTTVRQGTQNLGAIATKTLMSLLDGEPVVLDNVLPTELVIRGSCGCTVSSNRRSR